MTVGVSLYFNFHDKYWDGMISCDYVMMSLPLKSCFADNFKYKFIILNRIKFATPTFSVGINMFLFGEVGCQYYYFHNSETHVNW